MKKLFTLFSLFLILVSCGVQVPDLTPEDDKVSVILDAPPTEKTFILATSSAKVLAAEEIIESKVELGERTYFAENRYFMYDWQVETWSAVAWPDNPSDFEIRYQLKNLFADQLEPGYNVIDPFDPANFDPRPIHILSVPPTEFTPAEFEVTKDIKYFYIEIIDDNDVFGEDDAGIPDNYYFIIGYGPENISEAINYYKTAAGFALPWAGDPNIYWIQIDYPNPSIVAPEMPNELPWTSLYGRNTRFYFTFIGSFNTARYLDGKYDAGWTLEVTRIDS